MRICFLQKAFSFSWCCFEVGNTETDSALHAVLKTMFLNSIRRCLFLILSFTCFRCVSGAHIQAMK